MQVWYQHDKYVENTGGWIADDEWSRDSTSTSHSIGSELYLSKPPIYNIESDDVPDENLKPGDVVFMVWVQYSTGDSFGHDSGYGFEVIGFYKNAEDAYKAKAAVENGPKKYSYEKGGNCVEVPTYDGSGKRGQYCGGWVGYFESLDHVSITTMRVYA